VSTDEVIDRRLGDYAAVDQADAAHLVDRLDAMHALDAFRRYKARSFDLLGAAPGGSYADFGCGTGDDAAKLAQRVAPGGRVVGFDISEAMLTQGRERHGDIPGLSFASIADGRLDAADNSFDGVRADRVLIHTPDPRATLRELMRVTKPGGRVVISEPDMPGCWVAADDYDLAGQVMGEIARSCISPYFARDLMPAFKEAGLKDVSFEIWPVTAFDPAQVARILDLEGVVGGMHARGQLSDAQVGALVADFRTRGESGRFVAAVSIMVAAATKA
jgi:ubiquinone/menaquinone biosynthesis C-methylase UbiE